MLFDAYRYARLVSLQLLCLKRARFDALPFYNFMPHALLQVAVVTGGFLSRVNLLFSGVCANSSQLFTTPFGFGGFFHCWAFSHTLFPPVASHRLLNRSRLPHFAAVLDCSASFATTLRDVASVSPARLLSITLHYSVISTLCVYADPSPCYSWVLPPRCCCDLTNSTAAPFRLRSWLSLLPQHFSAFL